MGSSPERPRWTEYMPVAELAPALRNAKLHDLEAIAASFDEFGALEPTVLDERTGRLIGGHGRVEFLTAREAVGGAMPEGVWVDEEGRWCWLVTRGFRSRDDAHAHAAGLALNRAGERGGHDPLILAGMLDELAKGDPRLFEASGYTTADLDLLIASVAAPSPTDPEAEWEGMPEFDQQDRRAKYATTINFLTEDDAARFWREVLGQDKPRRSTWWPAHDGFQGSDQTLAYVAAEES